MYLLRNYVSLLLTLGPRNIFLKDLAAISWKCKYLGREYPYLLVSVGR